MKKQDLWFISGVILLFAPFFLWDVVYDLYRQLNREHGLVISFFKFAVLATAGESIGLRIRSGGYYHRNFGFLPRAVVWGLLGITIKTAFIIFAAGTPVVLEYLGCRGAAEAVHQGFSWAKLLSAFSISLAMNLSYAPVMMTLHKITDTHIAMNNGELASLIRPISFTRILNELNWDIQWNFVFRRTIPLFWIPAHTITFLLPPDFQVLFAALLGIVLGVILSVASLQST